MVSEGGASGARAVLDGAAAGHTQQSPSHRALEVLQPFPQHGARHARVDACVRLGPSPCRHRERTKAGAGVRFPRARDQNEKGNPLGHPARNRLTPRVYFTPPAARLFVATSLGLGTASTVSSRTKFGNANNA